MAKDFRASQIQTTKIISSGSSGTNANIVVYPISKQSTSNPNQGIIDPEKFGTGSIGNDIFFYVSGGIGERGDATNAISVFGGDLHISGNLTSDLPILNTSASLVTYGITDYASTTNTSSLPEAVGQVRFDSSKFGSDVFLGSILTAASASVSASIKLLNLDDQEFVEIGGSGIDTLSSVGTDSTFITSVDLTTALNFNNLSSSNYELQLYSSNGAVPVIVGGAELRATGAFTANTIESTTFVSGNTAFRMSLVDFVSTEQTGSNPKVAGQIVFPADEFSGSLTLRALLSNTEVGGVAAVKLYNLNSTSFVEIAGPSQTELSVTGTTPTVVESVDLYTATNFNTSSATGYELQFFSSTGSNTAQVGGGEFRPSGSFTGNTISTTVFTSGSWVDETGKLRTTASVAISSEGEFAESLGEDVYFYVSGTFGSGSSGDKIALFGGDVKVSGTLSVGSGSTFIKDDRITFTSASIRNVDGVLTFIDDENLVGQPLSSLAGGGFFYSNTADLIEATGSVEISASMKVSGGLTVGSLSPVTTQTGFRVLKQFIGGVYGTQSFYVGPGTIGEGFAVNTFTYAVQGDDGTHFVRNIIRDAFPVELGFGFGINATGSAERTARIGLFKDSIRAGGLAGTDTTSNGYLPGLNIELPSATSSNNNLGFRFGSTNVARMTSNEFQMTGAIRATENIESAGAIVANAGLSGSLTTLSDGSPYLLAGDSVTLTTESNGAITIASTASGSGGSGDSFFYSNTADVVETSGSLEISGSALVKSNVDITGGLLTVKSTAGKTRFKTHGDFGDGILVNTSSSFLIPSVGSSSIVQNLITHDHPNGGITFSFGINRLPETVGTTTATARFGFFKDSVRVGALTGTDTTGSGLLPGLNFDMPTNSNNNIGFKFGSTNVARMTANEFQMTGTIRVDGDVESNGLSGSLTTLSDGSPYLLAGDNVTLTTESNGAITIASSGSGGGSGLDSYQAGFYAGFNVNDADWNGPAGTTPILQDASWEQSYGAADIIGTPTDPTITFVNNGRYGRPVTRAGTISGLTLHFDNTSVAQDASELWVCLAVNSHEHGGVAGGNNSFKLAVPTQVALDSTDGLSSTSHTFIASTFSGSNRHVLSLSTTGSDLTVDVGDSLILLLATDFSSSGDACVGDFDGYVSIETTEGGGGGSGDSFFYSNTADVIETSGSVEITGSLTAKEGMFITGALLVEGNVESSGAMIPEGGILIPVTGSTGQLPDAATHPGNFYIRDAGNDYRIMYRDASNWKELTFPLNNNGRLIGSIHPQDNEGRLVLPNFSQPSAAGLDDGEIVYNTTRDIVQVRDHGNDEWFELQKARFHLRASATATYNNTNNYGHPSAQGPNATTWNGPYGSDVSTVPRSTNAWIMPVSASLKRAFIKYDADVADTTNQAIIKILRVITVQGTTSNLSTVTMVSESLSHPAAGRPFWQDLTIIAGSGSVDPGDQVLVLFTGTTGSSETLSFNMELMLEETPEVF